MGKLPNSSTISKLNFVKFEVQLRFVDILQYWLKSESIDRREDVRTLLRASRAFLFVLESRCASRIFPSGGGGGGVLITSRPKIIYV
jgi:hypothetical protein